MFNPYKILRNKIFHWLTDEPPIREILPFDFNQLRYEIRPGDVLLIEGRARISRVIRTITQSPWTHAALYIGRTIDIEDGDLQSIIRTNTVANDQTRLLVEDIIDRGTIITPLNFYRHHHIRICRPIGITPEDMHAVIAYAIKALGQPYSVRHLLDLARFLLPWSILPRRWGSSLFRTSTGEPESGICSSLIAKAFEVIQFPILPYLKPDDQKRMEVFPRNPYLFTPKDFDYSPYFEIIKYPLFNIEDHIPYYRRLPWTKDNRIYNDHGVLNIPKKKMKRKFFAKEKLKLQEEMVEPKETVVSDGKESNENKTSEPFETAATRPPQDDQEKRG